MKIYQNVIKRGIDLTFASVTTLILSPLLIAVTIWLKVANKGAGAFFTQERPGFKGRPFKIYKFKSMTDERDADGNLLPDEKRLTVAGKFVRSTSIDELPQLFNVIKGDMALIGPRPLLMQYLQLYTPEQMRRHDVRPGITGWAQCHGRNTLSWEDKFKLDVWYVDNCSLLTDAKVFLISLKKVIIRDGISAEGQATMQPFTGSQQSKDQNT